MPSLAQLLAAHGRVLVLDAVSTTVHVGLFAGATAPVWHASPTEAGTALFEGVAVCLARAGASLDDICAFAYCEGPGSMLGARTAAMSIRTWQAAGTRLRPAYRYQSLALAAHALARRGEPAPFDIVADARRDTWHLVPVDATGRPGALQRVAAADLSARSTPVWTPREFKAWSTPPRSLAPFAYAPPTQLATTADADLFSLSDAPDALQHETPVYKKWSPGVHSAATRAAPSA